MATYLEQLADAAKSGYWPLHLLAPNEDRIVALGEALTDVVAQVEYLEGEADRAAELDEEILELQNELEILKESAKETE
jgi:hypothetical protein